MDDHFDPAAVAAAIRPVIVAVDADSYERIGAAWSALQNHLCLTVKDDRGVTARCDDPGCTGRAIEASSLSEDAKAALCELLVWGTYTGQGPGRFRLERRPGLRLLRAALDAVDDAWHGPDWDALPRQQRDIIRCMHGRESVTAGEFCRSVWGDDADRTRNGTISTAISRANAFLTGRGWPRTLHIDSAGGSVFWE
jgi:hypothetical protein